MCYGVSDDGLRSLGTSLLPYQCCWLRKCRSACAPVVRALGVGGVEAIPTRSVVSATPTPSAEGRALIVERYDAESDELFLSAAVRLGGASGYEVSFDGGEPLPAMGFLDRESVAILFVAFLPERASVVVVELPDGSRFSQQLVGGIAFLAIEDAKHGDHLEIGVLDALGNSIADQSHRIGG